MGEVQELQDPLKSLDRICEADKRQGSATTDSLLRQTKFAWNSNIQLGSVVVSDFTAIVTAPLSLAVTMASLELSFVRIFIKVAILPALSDSRGSLFQSRHYAV